VYVKEIKTPMAKTKDGKTYTKSQSEGGKTETNPQRRLEKPRQKPKTPGYYLVKKGAK
jgi:hypothetical protein